jgi:PAS domain S-box-containing protein
MDLDGHFTYVSPSVFQLRGYTSEETMKQSITEALTPNSAQIVLEALQKFHIDKSEPSSTLIELEQTCKDGSTVWIEVNVSIIRNKNGARANPNLF